MTDLHIRRAAIALLAMLLVGGIVAMAAVLVSSHQHDQRQLRAAVASRASLAGALIDSQFSGPYQPIAPAKAMLSRERVTGGDIAAARQRAPVTAVFAAEGRILATRPALDTAARREIASQPAVAAAFADGRHHLSNLLAPGVGRGPGFLETVAYRTRFGRRVLATWIPLRNVVPALDRYLGYVARLSGQPAGTAVYLLDGRNMVMGATRGATAGHELGDSGLRAAIDGGRRAGRFGRAGRRFFAAAPLTVGPWRVVYTAPTAKVYASQRAAWHVSLIALAGFALAAALGLVLLRSLLISTGRLSRVNAKLAHRSAQAERATAAKNRFVASLSHELRTPLNAVIGFTELMQEGRAGRLSRTQREYLGIVRSGADHLLALIDEAHDLARIEAGGLRLRPEAIDPAAVAQECVLGMRPLASERQVRISLEAPETGLAWLDPARLRQVILNFLSNAIKFSEPGGEVRLAVVREDDELVVACIDEGIGIAEADQGRVFDEFVQLGHRTHAGSGLGLAVTRQIVEAQGGRVGLRSRPGQGSTFTARLPWIASDELRAASPTAPQPWQAIADQLAASAPETAGADLAIMRPERPRVRDEASGASPTAIAPAACP